MLKSEEGGTEHEEDYIKLACFFFLSFSVSKTILRLNVNLKGTWRQNRAMELTQ